MRKLKHGKMSGGYGDSCCLKLEGLNVRIQGEEILEDVSFHLHCGEITALIGPNGAGKSTLFRSILGQLPYSGSITFAPAGGPAIRLADGTVMGGTRPLIGYVPQSPSFDRGDPVSVLDFFTAATARWPVCLPIPGKYRERCRRSLERVHGGDLLDRPMGGLSGGQLQRVLLAWPWSRCPISWSWTSPCPAWTSRGSTSCWRCWTSCGRSTTCPSCCPPTTLPPWGSSPTR